MKKPIILVALLAILAGCSTTNTVYVPQVRSPVNEPQTQAISSKKVTWQVITKPELVKMLADLNAHPDDKFALFALTPDGFQALSSNIVEAQRFMAEQKQVILYYRKYTEQTSTTPSTAKKK